MGVFGVSVSHPICMVEVMFDVLDDLEDAIDKVRAPDRGAVDVERISKLAERIEFAAAPGGRRVRSVGCLGRGRVREHRVGDAVQDCAVRTGTRSGRCAWPASSNQLPETAAAFARVRSPPSTSPRSPARTRRPGRRCSKASRPSWSPSPRSAHPRNCATRSRACATRSTTTRAPAPTRSNTRSTRSRCRSPRVGAGS